MHTWNCWWIRQCFKRLPFQIGLRYFFFPVRRDLSAVTLERRLPSTIHLRPKLSRRKILEEFFVYTIIRWKSIINSEFTAKVKAYFMQVNEHLHCALNMISVSTGPSTGSRTLWIFDVEVGWFVVWFWRYHKKKSTNAISNISRCHIERFAQWSDGVVPNKDVLICRQFCFSKFFQTVRQLGVMDSHSVLPYAVFVVICLVIRFS
jgi:hypothetical protein